MAEIPFDQLPPATQRRIQRHRRATRRTVREACLGSYMLRPHARGYQVVWASTPEARLAALQAGWCGVSEERSSRFSDALFLACLGASLPATMEGNS